MENLSFHYRLTTFMVYLFFCQCLERCRAEEFYRNGRLTSCGLYLQKKTLHSKKKNLQKIQITCANKVYSWPQSLHAE